VADEGDSYVALAEAAMRSSSEAAFFGTYLVDYIPILKYTPSWMPGASFRRKAREWRRLSREMLESQFNIVKQNIVSRAALHILPYLTAVQAKGTAVSCITTRELEVCSHSGEHMDEEVIKNITAMAYAGKLEFTIIRESANFQNQ
jgi:hypothetical protein